MQPERYRGTGPACVGGLSSGEQRAARRLVHQRVETLDPRTAVAGVHHVRGPVERPARPPSTAADVRAGDRTDDLRHVQPTVNCVLEPVAHHHRHHAVANRVPHRVTALLLHRHVRVPGRHHRHVQPDHAHRVRVGRPAAGRHLGRAVRRLPEREAWVHRRVCLERGPERGRPVPGPAVHLRHVRTVQGDRFAVQDHVRPKYRRQELQDRVRQARQPQALYTLADDRRLAVDRRSFCG